MVGQDENNRVLPKGVQESDSLIVPRKRVMIVEGRGGRNDAAIGGNMADTQRSESVFTKLDRLSRFLVSRFEEPDAGNLQVRFCEGPGG